jgi:transketolase
MRRIVLEQSFRAGVGHIGSALSVVDILAALYDNVLKIFSTDDPDRDRFVLSKGHAALALYAALHLKGWISEAELNTFCADGTSLGVHPEFRQRGVDFATGSLGQGLTFGVGAALAAKWQRSQRRVFVLLSDAECNEGSVWEAIMIAKQQQLGNLVAIVDVNGQQALDYTQNVIGLHPLEERWKAFGWDVHTVDGHDHSQLGNIMCQLDEQRGVPHVLLAKTVFGKGVSFMQGQIKWHYLSMSKEEYNRALRELEGNS